MLEFFSNNFENCLWLAIFLIAMIPGIEGRIAIPFAMTLSLNHPEISHSIAFFSSYLGCIAPCLPILFLCKFVKKKSTGFIFEKYKKIPNNKISHVSNNKHSSKIKNASLNLCLFVAIPLPLTGVWSGSLIGGFTNLSILNSFISIAIGCFISCVIIFAVCLLFGNYVIYFLIIAVIMIFSFLVFKLMTRLIQSRLDK